MYEFLNKFLSIKDEIYYYKVISIFGIKIKFKNKNVPSDKSTQLYEKKARDAGVKIGKNNKFVSELGFGSEPWLIEIGNNNLFSCDITFLTHDGSIHTLENLYNDNLFKIGKIVIKDNCFIGCRSIILPNVCIGNNAILGAGSVLTKDIPDNEVWAGNPAKKICNVEDLYKKYKENDNNPALVKLSQFSQTCRSQV